MRTARARTGPEAPAANGAGLRRDFWGPTFVECGHEPVVVGGGEGRGHKAQDLLEERAYEGKDDAWIAGALGTSPGSIQSFRSRRRIPTEAIRGRRSGPGPLPGVDTDDAGPRYEGVIERGGGGRVGLWMDPAVAEDAVYRERWATRRKVGVRISGRRIVVDADDDR